MVEDEDDGPASTVEVEATLDAAGLGAMTGSGVNGTTPSTRLATVASTLLVRSIVKTWNKLNLLHLEQMSCVEPYSGRKES